ncbi:MAG: hypothetical protein UT24_C0014G0029 [Candidatus Woesebacteria bacterium GW2011_GWB1_39_12]|uniref:Uncharacterized protein n=2 Tax=Candidatus Woeseibacteriota TaxID=1752722 RepID=A0A0G0MD12_9BACT|nr:MAG: hypothetical protein UT23_C0004G0054 [Candidatus Woesebacteria bacterium GW2011_GWA1_39_12]KKR00289.1 MAG: hypothetical protein UT24_C0014G0029 [Candidatus Woesebacteria bacterium GW2011_GWB1_39_12]
MENPRYPRTLTDSVVEEEIPKGGTFRIVRDQHSHTQGAGGVDVVSRVSGGVEHNTIVPRTDSIPPTEGAEMTIWRRR